ncbi:YbaB/EbfC family nucleoid-associated protein [Actinoallomurus soli]|uniref:YbaB/EbfC family nucleoid-associated protein n=1 Tax=Actinoallomurus soli TaxID=2952535 RepID=UPI002092E242|nr:YbaB/EbfC family nucleoid-associated protein [Actinoallomurus soli]MCO5968790.1 YbaB/EbfC family nucleoid-associated protein [Actinoallomurus soli]
MNEFGHLANLDIDRLMRIAEEQAGRVEEMQRLAAEIQGVAESRDKQVKVVCTVNDGVADIRISPRAMRMPSGEFAELLKILIRDAQKNLNDQLHELMTEAYGEEANPLALAANQEAIQERLHQAAAAYDRTLNDAMSEMERIAKQLGL